MFYADYGVPNCQYDSVKNNSSALSFCPSATSLPARALEPLALGGALYFVGFMPRIRGKFAPILEELGNDSRFLLELNDFEKLLFYLVIQTIYWCNNSAPDMPQYYKQRYALRHRTCNVAVGLEHIKAVYPKLVCKDKKLSLSNYKGYKNMVDTNGDREVEVEEELETETEYNNGAFDKFWSLYPKKQNKVGAKKAFEKLSPKCDLLLKILNAVESHKLTDQWKRENGQFVPMASTFLNQKRWEDEIKVDSKKALEDKLYG